jgi:hypothetical protein
MTVERARVIPFFKEIHLFAGMDEAQLSRAARYFREQTFQPDEVIVRQGAPGDHFFIIEKGDVVITRRIRNVDTPFDMLTQGDYFGEESLIRHIPRSVTVKAFNDVTVLVADRTQFFHLLDDFPSMRLYLDHIIASRRFIRTHRFNWLHEDEVVYQVRRKHVVLLVLALIIPGLILLLGLGAALFGISLLGSGAIGTATLGLGIALLVVGFAWGAWNALDWSNDYYIVTNQRVVWIEEVIGLYESRYEAPLEAVRGTNVKTTFWGRVFDYGDVLVSTYTGELPLRMISYPNQMDAVIREFWQRVKRMNVAQQKQETIKDVMRILGQEAPPPASEPKLTRHVDSRPTSSGDMRELTFTEQYLGNLFRLRVESAGVITYRKHWLILLAKAWWSSLLIGLLWSAMIGSLLMILFGNISFTLGAAIIGVAFVISLPLGGVWLYNYADWANDIYQITQDSIFDIERKPFGDEHRTSAPLDRVISLNHERRGLLGYIFNIGDVVVNVGDAKLTFDGVYQPARVQQDVFLRMQEQLARKQKTEVSRERDRILSLLEIYHQKINQPPADPEDNI